MKRLLGLTFLTVLLAGGAWWFQAGSEERAVRQVLSDMQAAALSGLNRRDAAALDAYFATQADGALPDGLAETQQAYRDFAAALPGNNAVQFHSLEIQSLQVHKDAGLAKVTYRLHFSVLRSGQVIYSARAEQNLALVRTPRGWRIMGGDAPQLFDVTGAWPPR